MKLETVKLSELHPLENNVRLHSEAQIDALVKSLDQFGQTRAFVVDEQNNILIGNGMYEAMVKRGDKTGEVYRVTGLSEQKKKKLILSDNKVFSLGSDDFGQIEAYIQDITADGDFDIAGFDEEALRALTRSADEILNDVMSYGKVEEKPAPTVVTSEAVPAAGPVEQAAETPSPAPAPDIQRGVEPAETIKTIVCPSCGEVIRL